MVCADMRPIEVVNARDVLETLMKKAEYEEGLMRVLRHVCWLSTNPLSNLGVSQVQRNRNVSCIGLGMLAIALRMWAGIRRRSQTSTNQIGPVCEVCRNTARFI